MLRQPLTEHENPPFPVNNRCLLYQRYRRR